MKLSFNRKQTDTLVQKEVERLRGDGISKLLFGNDIVDYCEPEIPDCKEDRDVEELRFDDAEVEILIKDYVDSLKDPYAELTEMLGTDSFIVDEVMDPSMRS